MPSEGRKGKWQPFDGLEGYKNTLQNVEYEKGKIPKPILLPDRLEELNEELQKAVRDDNEVLIVYYHNGYYQEGKGRITRIDPIRKVIYLEGTKISVSMIVKLKAL